jgi:hypothetical protein
MEPITKGIKRDAARTEVEKSPQPGTPTKNVYNATLNSKLEKEWLNQDTFQALDEVRRQKVSGHVHYKSVMQRMPNRLSATSGISKTISLK